MRAFWFPRRLPPWPVLLAVALLLACIAVGLAVWSRLSSMQAARARIKALGGLYSVRDDRPDWLRERFPNTSWGGWFDRITQFNLSLTAVTDQDLRELLRCAPEVEDISLLGTRVSDASLERIASLDEIRLLLLSETGITSRGVAQLGQLTSLEVLYLQNTATDGSALEALGSCSYLRELWLAGTLVNDQACTALASLPELETLDLGRTRVTDSGVPALARSPMLDELHLADNRIHGTTLHTLRSTNIRILDLSGTDISNDTLRNLKGMTSLEALDLSGTAAGDAAIETLAALPNLRRVALMKTGFTEAGRRKLRELKPKLTVHPNDDAS